MEFNIDGDTLVPALCITGICLLLITLILSIAGVNMYTKYMEHPMSKPAIEVRK